MADDDKGISYTRLALGAGLLAAAASASPPSCRAASSLS